MYVPRYDGNVSYKFYYLQYYNLMGDRIIFWHISTPPTHRAAYTQCQCTIVMTMCASMGIFRVHLPYCHI